MVWVRLIFMAIFKFLKIISPKISFKDSAFGWDGLSTFIVSNILLLATLGLGFLYLFLKTLMVAYTTKTSLVTNKTCLVAGLRLDNEQPAEEFISRLNRVLCLSQQANSAGDEIKIIILGGITGDNYISEAQAGADYLITQGVDEKQIMTEDHSRHTLENLQNARKLLLNLSLNSEANRSPALSVAIISSRYHLYRIMTLGRGLNLALTAVAAEDKFNLSLSNLLRLFKEAYYLHWYWSGKLWVLLTGNKKSQSRIT